MEKGTIICVDDESIVLTGLKSQLKRYFENEYNIETAESAEEALEIFEDLLEDSEEIPLIISDQIMPGMKGDELLVKIHQLRKNTLKILLTGQADARAVGNSVNNANLYRYIAKPWDEADLTLTVKEALRSYFQDKKLEQQNAELLELNQSLEQKVRERTLELLHKNELLEEQKRNITDSIRYAQRIQRAIMPSDEVIHEILNEHFILFRPRDIVSGDFYWMRQIKNFICVAAADCTGHGVPGAFMSMLGTSFLNEIVTAKNLDNSGEILNRLRVKVKKSLRQTGAEGEQKDGMDIAFYVIDTETLELQFSGAYNPLYIIRSSNEDLSGFQKPDRSETELIHLKADRQPIAVHIRETNFTTQRFQLQKGDCIYSFSDGYADQFGGEDGGKFMSRNLKNLLQSIADRPMKEQREILNQTFENWLGTHHEQIDDVLIIGVRIL